MSILDLQAAIGLASTGTVTVDAAHAGSYDLTAINNMGGGDYAVDPAFGSVIDNLWSGTFGNPTPNDIVTFRLTLADASQNVVLYSAVSENGDVSPAIGIEVLAVNSGGVLAQQINGYFKGESASQIAANLNINQFFVFSRFDLDTTEPGFVGPTDAQLSFSQTVCFAAGTRIACETGDFAVDDLRRGDLVRLADGDALPVVWIGRREIDCGRHPRPETVLPIRIAPGAFGEGTPRRPLFLSPEHAVFTGGVLIPIRLLVNGTSIRQVERETVTYYHVELERHAILLAEGLEAESFLDTGNRSWFDNEPTAARSGTERSEITWECRACAPLVLTGSHLEVARLRVAAHETSEFHAVKNSVPDSFIPRDCHIALAQS